ncbi:kyphoscoliosis peptidase-like [Bufo bufo]|uniref:kyphoscoliosis peptidase-like n=1 Tax=Bufo bufo TaxID=8384 RepID=UPI001ABE4FC4|nr:kyphoscoliosis peptidase-like [Bufo bufo]
MSGSESQKQQFLWSVSDYPWDGSSLKSLEIDLKALGNLDHFASKLDTKGTVEELVQALIYDAKTELEKTRAIWIWICYHIEYDTKGYNNKALRSSEPNEILRTRKGVCAGYASLFQRMCSIAGLQCKKISGYSKGAGYQIGEKFPDETDHAWNMIYLEGSWHLLDSTWGAGHTDDNVSKFTFKYNEIYFLTHPAIFITNHLPEEPDCQLLETCLSREQYEKIVKLNEDYYNLGMVSYHPQTCVIETVKGKVSIVIKSRCNMKFSFTLNKTERPGLLTLTNKGMNLDVYPQKTGKHILSIFASNADSDKEYKPIMDYRVDCSFVDTSMIIPKCLNNPVGPNWISEKAGFLQPSHSDPVIYAEDGTCMITFALKKDIKLLCTLESDEVNLTKEMASRNVLQTQSRDNVEIKVHLPSSGTYVLLIFFKPSDSTSSSYKCGWIGSSLKASEMSAFDNQAPAPTCRISCMALSNEEYCMEYSSDGTREFRLGVLDA